MEDDSLARRLMVRLLCELGYSATPAADVHEALQAAAQLTFDLVVSDIELPDGNGRDLMRALQKHAGLRGIAVSALCTEDEVRHSLEAGFAQHLAKPIDVDRLQEAIEAMCASRA